MSDKRSNKAQRRDILLGRIVAGLWIAVFVWVVSIFFYVMVTERYFSEGASSILLFIPWTMVTVAILLQAWRKYGKRDRTRFYKRLMGWGIIWAAVLFESIIERM